MKTKEQKPKFKKGDWVGYRSDSDFTRSNRDLPPHRICRVIYGKDGYSYHLSNCVGDEMEYSLEARSNPI